MAHRKGESVLDPEVAPMNDEELLDEIRSLRDEEE